LFLNWLKIQRLNRRRMSTGMDETFPRAVTPRNTPIKKESRSLLLEIEISIRNRTVAKNQMSVNP
jgi:hypothetical protein